MGIDQAKLNLRVTPAQPPLDKLPLQPVKNGTSQNLIVKQLVAAGMARAWLEVGRMDPAGIKVALAFQREQFVGRCAVSDQINLPPRAGGLANANFLLGSQLDLLHTCAPNSLHAKGGRLPAARTRSIDLPSAPTRGLLLIVYGRKSSRHRECRAWISAGELV